MKLTVCGMGYVGLVTAVCLAEFGHEVCCVDVDSQVIDGLKKETSVFPFFEKDLPDLFFKNKENLSFTVNLSEALHQEGPLLICVGTPQGSDGRVNLESLESIFEELSKVKSRKTIVIKSTVPVGTALSLQEKYLSSQECEHLVVSNPEFLRQGSAIENFLNPDRVVVGFKDRTIKALIESIYSPLLGRSSFLYMDNNSAEMSKYVSNSFLSTKISFINEMASLSERLGADIMSVKEAFVADHRINAHFFNHGLGYGGSCLPKDISALISSGEANDLEMNLLRAVRKVNETRPGIAIKILLQQLGGDLSGRKISLLGLSFKADTDDLRESKSIQLAKELISRGAEVVGYDSNVKSIAEDFKGFRVVQTASEATAGSSALILATESKEFKILDMLQIKNHMKEPLLIDGRNILCASKMRGIGFNYFGVV